MKQKHEKSAENRIQGKCNYRFKQLLDLAHDGDELAVHDLWAEFGFIYHGKGAGHE